MCVTSSWRNLTKRKPNGEFSTSLLVLPVCLQSVVCLTYMCYMLDLSVLPVCVVYLLCLCLAKGQRDHSVFIGQHQKQHGKGQGIIYRSLSWSFTRGVITLLTTADLGEHSELQILSTCIYVFLPHI